MSSPPSSPQLLDKPKRGLTSYNIFFKDERHRLLESLPSRPGCKKPRKSHGKIGFAEMARAISSKWKMITPENKAYYDELAAQDKVRYKSQMAAWNEQRSLRAQLAPEELTEATPTASPSSSGDVDCHPKDADDFERLADLVSFEDGYDEAGAIMPEPYMMDPVPFNQSYMGYDSALTNRFTLQQLAHNLGREGQDFLIAAFRKY